jgi:hypothetical protein
MVCLWPYIRFEGIVDVDQQSLATCLNTLPHGSIITNLIFKGPFGVRFDAINV